MRNQTGKRRTPSRRSQRTVQAGVRKDGPFAVLEAINLPVSLISPQYIYEWVNSCYADAHGKKTRDIIGSTVASVWGEETFNNVIKGMLDRCFEGMRVRDKAWMLFPASGRRYCEVVYSPYRSHSKGIASALVLTYDITDRREMEERLSQSEQRFRDLSEASLEAIVFMEDGIIVDGNKALSSMFGYELDEARGRLATDFIAPDRRGFTEERIKARVEGAYDTVGIRKDGSLFPMEVNPKELPVRGRSLRVSVIRDLTERKRIEAELRAYQEDLEKLVEERTKELKKSEENFRSIFENATEGIFQIIPDGRFLTVNPAFARIHGYDSPEDFLAEVINIEQLHVEPDRRRAYMALLHKEGRVRNFEFEIYHRNGAVTWVSVNARAVRDETGAVLYHEGTVQDITQRKLATEQILMQRDLAFQLAQVADFDKGLTIILETALRVSGMEGGGIYLKREPSGDLELISSIGLPDEFVRKVRRLEVGSASWSFHMQGKSAYMAPDKEQTPLTYGEGVRNIALIPILTGGRVIGTLNVGSRNPEGIPEQGRISLDFLSAELGAVIARMQAQQQLEREVETRKQAEKTLEAERVSLQEANTALKVLLKHREEDKKELEERLVANVKQLVLPYVEKLKKGRLEPSLHTAVEFIEGNLKDILSPLLSNLRSFNFTPRQLEIIALIKEGRTTKDIAELLHVSKDTIDKQRFLIRKKLDINKEKASLRSFLLSLA